MRKRLSFAILLTAILVAFLFVTTKADVEKLNNLTGINSIVYDGRTLWALQGRTLYNTNPSTGDIINKINISEDGESLAYDGRNLLISQNKTKKVYTIDQGTGLMNFYLDLAKLSASQDMHILPLKDGTLMSLTYQEEKLWVGCGAGYSTSIYEVDPYAQKVVSQFFAPGPTPYGLYLRGGNIWVLDKDASALHCLLNKKNRGMVDGIPVAPDAVAMTVIGDEIVLAGTNSSRGSSQVSVKLLDDATAVGLKRLESRRAPVDKPFTCDSRSGKYAVIVSGDTANASFDEFWSDCIFMAKTLNYKCGYSPANIYVLYYDGQKPNFHDTACPSYYKDDAGYLKGSAYKNNVITTLKNVAAQNPEEVFIYTFDHGASDNGLCLPDGRIYPSEFDNVLSTNFTNTDAKIFIYMQQCYSGGFVTSYVKSRPNTAILTACNASQTAYRSSHTESLNSRTWHHGEYNWWFMGSIAKQHPHGENGGAEAGANVNNVQDIRNYVIQNAAGSEQELYDDDGEIGQDWP